MPLPQIRGSPANQPGSFFLPSLRLVGGESLYYASPGLLMLSCCLGQHFRVEALASFCEDRPCHVLVFVLSLRFCRSILHR